MDKNKSRTDLLAAGRKKLQQFRQKKDSKGSSSHGKSSRKSGKSELHEADADAASTTAKPAAPSQVPEGEIASHVDSESRIVHSSVSNAVENSIAPDIDAATVDPLSVPIAPETSVVETVAAHNAQSPPQESRVGECDDTSSVLNDGQSTRTVDDEAERITSSKTLEMPDSEGETSHGDASIPVEVFAPHASADATDVAVTVESETMNMEEEVSLPSQEDIPDTSLTHARGYQEADGSGSRQLDRGTESELHGSGRLALSEFSESAETLEGAATGGTVVEESTSEVKQTGGEDNVSASACASNLSDGFSAPALALPKVDGNLVETLEGATTGGTFVEGATSEAKQTGGEENVSASACASSLSDVFLAPALALPKADGNLVVNLEVTTQQSENLVEKSEMLSGHGDSGNYKEGVLADTAHMKVAEGYSQQYLPEGSFMSEGKIHESPPETDTSISRSVSPVADLSSISLLQLMEVIRGLGEDEYTLLLKSKDSVSNTLLGTGSLIVPENGLPDLLEKLKEELFLSKFSKDIFHLQLTEQSELQEEYDHQRHQLVNEMSILTASLNEVREKNKIHTEELAQCRSELQAVASGREELQNQLCTAKAEAEELSARGNELQISLERSQGDLLSLSMEFADCKGLVEALQLENENLNGTLASVAEERRKLVDEQAYHLHENENLSTELADCKSLVAALQVENSNLCGSLASVTDERKKLEEEKEYISLENEKLLSELADCKSLAAVLQVENANLNGNLMLVTEERKKLEEDKEYFVRESERLSSELLVLQEQLSTEHGERMQVEVDLKEATLCLEQLTQENIFLNSSLDIHKAKITEIRNGQTQIPSPAGEAGKLVASLEVLSMDHENATNDEDSHQITGKQDGEVPFQLLEKPLSDGHAGGLPLEQLEQELFNDAFGFVVLKGHLEEAENIMHKLEKAIEGIHSHSASLSRSAGKVAAPGISKLIQAFESKGHLDDHEVEERALTEDRSSADPFMLAKEQTGNLRAVLKQLGLDAENASELFKGERDGRKTANVTFRELKVQYEALKEHNYHLEAGNIELWVLYEGVKQHVCNVEAKNSELDVLYEALKQEDISLKAENGELGKKLSKYESRIGELHSQLCDLQQSSEEMASGIGRQLEILQKEATERVSILEEEWKSTVAHIVEPVQKLEEIIGRSSTSTISSGTYDSLDVNSRVAASVNSAIKVIVDLQDKLEVVRTDHEAIYSTYEEVNEKFNTLHGKNELVIGILQKLYGDLKKLVIDSCGVVKEGETNIQNENLLDPVDPSNYENLMEQLGVLLSERLQLESVNNELSSELMSRTKDLEEMKKKNLDFSAINKLIEDVEGLVKLEDSESNKPPVSRLESLFSLLVQKLKEADEQVSLSREECESKVMELTELQEKIHQLNALNLQHENEFPILKGSLSQAGEALTAVRSKLQEKVTELEQSEQRVLSIREKLGIAVAKGKNLIVQRDGLKQSLAETSSELERCSQELQLKDTRLHEVETKLKTYSEAGERMEALESELSYIRNSATALRESFLLKDSVLQRIEEILEDLELPEHFHSREIIEKVDWLARSATGNSFPMTDWDQKSSVGGGSYSDAGFVVMDAWKDDAQPSSNSGDDLRRKHEELQSKFYGLAEQNEMLEQSLMERNNLVQRWEELLDRINMPSHLRSVEPEDRIEWLGSALSEAHHDRNSLHQKIINLENYCESLNADLEESQRRIADLEADHQDIIHERKHLSERLEILTRDHDKLSAKTVQFELVNEKLQNEVTCLQEKLVEKLGNEEHIRRIEGEIRRLQDLVSDALQDPGTNDFDFGGSSTECLEGLLRKLIENYATLSSVKPVLGDAVDEHHTEKADATPDEMRIRDTVDIEELGVAVLKEELEVALGELMHVKEERDIYIEKHQSLIGEVEALDKKRKELQELLNQEEQKSASMREKLNVAVRKGKSLVQQRDSLKQTIEEMNAELEHLKSEINHRENALAEYEQKIRNLSTYSERVKALESESLLLRNHLAETERYLQEKGHTLSMVLNTLGDIDVGSEISTSDPVEKLEWIGKLCCDLHAAVAYSEQESRKSKRAAELLLAELNEVQERNDELQEEFAKAAGELTELSMERDVAEAAKLEALSRLEELSTAHSDERKNQISELKLLKSGIDQLRKGLSDSNNLVTNVFSEDLEFLHNLASGLESCLRPSGAADMVGEALFSASGGIISTNSENKENFLSKDYWSDSTMQDRFEDNVIIEVCSFVGHHLQEFIRDISALKENLHKHSVSLHEQAGCLSKVMKIVCQEMTSRKESNETMKRDIIHLESIEKEKDMEIVVLRRNIALLYESCTSSIVEIENSKAEVVGNPLAVGDLGMNLKSATFADGGLTSSGPTCFSSEEFIRTVADRVSLAVKDFVSMKTELLEGGQKEMKITIANLQKELQEKDIQKDRICKELVTQIKGAEAAAASYSSDLQSSKTRVHDLEKWVEEMDEERNSLEQRIKELQDGQAASTELQERVRSLTDVLAAKDQEIEALMQALDEEEVQMEDLTNKIEKLEKVVRQKNLDLENLEASRRKVMKKLSITVSKFDELHHLSGSLLSEVEKLQSQLHDRDAEISFLRQEVTKCTNDVLVASQMRNKRNSDEIHEFLTWFDSIISRVGEYDVHLDGEKSSQVHEYKEILQKKVTSIISELEDLRAVAQSRDALLQVERSKVEELTHKAETLAKSLREKESQLNLLQGGRDSGRATSVTSEIVEVEPVINKWAVTGTSTAPQVRSLRKVNNDQVAIAIDMDPVTSSRLEDEDDDKVHGFKSLTTSRIVPKFTRPVTDMIDGLWVSCDRALMRQPALRLGIIIYWAVLHALLATFVV